MPERVGLMGGTFDPVHNGHLVAAEESRYALDLARVVFVPAGYPWQKTEADVSLPDVRFEMTQLAVAGNPAFEVSRLEIDRDGPTYTVDTLRSFGRCSPDAELYFITGADAILQILTWRDADVALDLATFVAVTRPGHDLASLGTLGPRVRERVRVIEIPALAISSTDIRRRVSEGRPIRYLVPDSVATFIDERGLYRAS